MPSSPLTPPAPRDHAILFFGEILPGHDALICRRQLQALLKCPAETMDTVFSGQRVSLRSGLDADAAERFRESLEEMGLRVEVDPPLPGVPTSTHGDSGMLGVGLEGRFGRRNFLMGGLVVINFSMLVSFAGAGLGDAGALFYWLSLGLVVLYGLRGGVWRLHDLGFSGWWIVLTGLPYLASLIGVLLLVLPGKRGANAWGTPARPVSLPALLGGLLATVVTWTLFVAMLHPDARNPAPAGSLAKSGRSGPYAWQNPADMHPRRPR